MLARKYIFQVQSSGVLANSETEDYFCFMLSFISSILFLIFKFIIIVCMMCVPCVCVCVCMIEACALWLLYKG